MTKQPSSSTSPSAPRQKQPQQEQQQQQQGVSQERGSHTRSKKNPGKRPSQGGSSR